MDRLSLRRIAGGSVIETPPLFSADGETLFILRADIHTNTVRSYSTNTGELISNFEEANGHIVNIQTLPNQPKVLLGCTHCGEIVKWEVKSGTIIATAKMNFHDKSVEVTSFNIIPYETNLHALITWTRWQGDGNVEIGIFDLETGDKKFVPLKLGFGIHKVAISRNDYNIIAVIQGCKLFVTSKKGRSNSFRNASNVLLKSVACHPEQEIVAVGDATGKIFLYYDLYKKTKNPKNELYHWHHYSVETISFTSSGSMLYSGGPERVLIGWYTAREQKKKPRLNGTILHINVSANNQKIAVTTDDNAITVLDPQFDNICVIQNFVMVADDGTPWPKLPIGLKVDPRTDCILLNGRAGQLQFYSPYDGTFFSLDVTMENRLSLESECILYSTRITHVACNVNWLVTAECLDDLQHFPEVRLKFWFFDAAKKAYVLCTQIELPHDGGVTALEFSSPSNVENLLCASSGNDKKVKIWSLEETEVIDNVSPLNGIVAEGPTKTRNYWACQAVTSYKDLPVNSLAFSSDGSSLVVGFGNALCIYVPATLFIKTVLTAPSGLDGQINKLIISKPKSLPSDTDMTKEEQNKRIKLTENRKQNVQMIRSFLEDDDDKLLLKEIREKAKNQPENINDDDRTRMVSVSELGIEEKEKLFKPIIRMNELDFHQKLDLFQKIGIPINVPADLEDKFHTYVIRTMNVEQRERYLEDKFKDLSPNTIFIGQMRLENYLARRNPAVNEGLHLKNVKFVDDDISMSHNGTDDHVDSMEIDDTPKWKTDPIRKLAKINHVSFATGDSSHFVIVCTENRLLIWNLLTLRLHGAFKLRVKLIAVDPCTSLVAAFTADRELYVFEPSKPYILYQRKDMPKIVGAVWLRRRHPKQQSLDVDWQSFSQLFFLTEMQELFYLVADNDEDLLTAKGASLQEVDQLEPLTHFGAMIARQITDDTVAVTGQRNIAGGLVGDPTKNIVNSLVNLQTHTMAPVRSLSYNFLTSILSSEMGNTNNRSRNIDQAFDLSQSDEDDSETEETSTVNQTINQRKEWSRRENMVGQISDGEHFEMNKKLQTLLSENIKELYNIRLISG